ncbi:MAG: DUF6505 family protein, partial [Pseudomonadota bacterium]
MPKFLKAVRLDDSDAELYATSAACDEDEWVCTGGFTVCDLASGYRCEPRCYCDTSFLSITRRARVTLAEVVDVNVADLEIFKDQLAQHLLFDWKAPDFETARAIAEEEIDYTTETASGFPTEVWITVKRSPGIDGAIDEKYDQYER